MIQNNFGQVASGLLDALGLEHTGTISSITDLRRALRGNAIDVKRIDIVKGTMSYDRTLRGGLLYGKDFDVLSFVQDDNGLLKILGAKGARISLGPDQLQKYSYALVLKERRVLLDGISPFFRQYSGRLWDIIAAAFLINLFALTFPLFSSFVYDKILGNGIYETLWALAICLVIVLCIEFFMRLIRIRAAERLAVQTETDIDYGVFQRLLRTHPNQLPSIAVFMEKYKQIISYRDFLSSSYLLSLADIPFLFLFLIAIAIIAGPMVALVVIFGGALSAVSSLLLKPVLEHEAVAKKGSEKRLGLVNDLLSSREVIIGSAFQNEFQDKLQKASVESSIASSHARYWRGVGMSFSNSLSYLSYVGILVAGVYMVESHDLTAGGLLAVSMLSSRAMSSMSSVSGLILRYKEFQSALGSMNAVLPDISVSDKIAHGKLSGSIHLENVTCRVRGDDNNPVLDKINIQIPVGQIVGIAGAPGCGKTTLLRLVAGVLSADKGRVMMDDIPVDNISSDDMSISLGYKPQDLCLIEGTIDSNVRAGRVVMNGGDRTHVLQSSGLEFAFRESGLNWHTEVGVRGGHLSGGQRQLVSIARAMAYHPSVLLLDEPTNGLDSHLEAHLAQQILALKGKCTVLVSTHSHNILSVCDRIIVLGQSKILADGPKEKVLVSK